MVADCTSTVKLAPETSPNLSIIVNLLTWPIASIGWVTIVQSCRLDGKTHEFFSEKPDFESGTHKPASFQGQVEFKNVSFTYPNGIQALDKVSFTVEAGHSLGILGKTGSGKSTITALMVRQYDPSEGQILVDGNNIKDWHLPTLKKYWIGIPQEAFLFSDTIAHNIAFGLDTFNIQKVEYAARAAGVHENIIDFPKGYETKANRNTPRVTKTTRKYCEFGQDLSMVFDDCLSLWIQKPKNLSLATLKKQPFYLLDDHRTQVSSVKHCEQIICLDNGAIIEKSCRT